ncbi:MAG: extracellular solute-binding protein [Clostridia bacterium]
MKKISLLCITALLFFACSCAQADGVTLKTVSIFAGTDAAADTYAALLKKWQDETGNTVSDFSATSDEAWTSGVLTDFAAGNEADVMFFFAKTADSEAILSKVTPIADINAAYPEAHLTMDKAVTELNGQIYAIPVRPYWEALFCNVDLFERYELALPDTWEKLETAVKTFRDAGIVPIAVSLSDVPHYLAEFCILCAGSDKDYTARPAAGESVPQSWVEGMALIHRLYEMGAFTKDVNATTEAATSQMFREKKAAMQVDGSWFANSLTQEGMLSTAVIPFPALRAQKGGAAYISGVSMGFYLSRAAWKDSRRRDAAVDLLRFLTTGENVTALGVYNISGMLLESYQNMEKTVKDRYTPIQDDMQSEARGKWLSCIPGVADGSVDPEKMWAEIMEMDPFAAR